MMESVDAAPCGAYNMHGEHTYREGFLWLTKKRCSGTYFPGDGDKLNWDPVAEVNAYLEHKHNYQVKTAFSFGPKRDEDILWHCECGNYFVVTRDLFWRTGITYDTVLPANV